MNGKKNVAVRATVMFVSIIFAVMIVGCGTSPKDAINKNNSKAITKMYKEAKDKNKMAEEIRQAFLEKAVVIIDKKDNTSRLKEERTLLSTLYPMNFYDTDDATKYLLNAYNDFERASNADSSYVEACQNFYKNNGMQFTSLSGSDLEVSKMSVYIASKVNRDDPKSTEYYCTGHKKIFSTFDAMQMSGYVGRIIDNPDIPDDSFECVLDFGSNKYVKSGVVDVTAIFVKSGDFTDMRGFNKKLDIFRVVNPHIAQDIKNTSKKQAEYLETKKTFKDNAKSGNEFSYRPKKTEKGQDEAKTDSEERNVQSKQTKNQRPQNSSNENSLNRKCIITGENVYVRSGPGKGYDTKGYFEDGEPVTALGEKGGWYRVTRANGQQCWVWGTYIIPATSF